KPGIVVNDNRISIFTLQLESCPVIWFAPLLVSHHLQFCSSKCGGWRHAFLQHQLIEVSHQNCIRTIVYLPKTGDYTLRTRSHEAMCKTYKTFSFDLFAQAVWHALKTVNSAESSRL